jgi:hypothetical protein
MDAVIEITQHGASVTYVRRGPSVSPWHATLDLPPDSSRWNLLGKLSLDRGCRNPGRIRAE